MKNTPSSLNPVPILYLRLVRRQKVHIGAYLLLLLLTAGLQLPIPFFLSKLIDGLSHGINSSTLSMNIIGIVGLSVLSLLLSTLGKIYSATLNQRFLLDIRLTAFESLQQAPLWFSRKFDISDLQTRFTSDVGTLNYFLPTGLADAIRHVFFVLTFGLALVYTSPAIVIYIVGLLPLAAMIYKIASRRFSTLSDEARASYADASATIQESLTSLREGRITGSRQFHLSRLRSSLERSEVRLFRTRRYNALMIGALGFIPVMVTAIIWMVGGAKVDAHEMSIGQLVSFLLILSMLYGPISGLFDAASGYVYELAAFRRVASLLYVPSNPDQDRAYTLTDVTPPPSYGKRAPIAFELRDIAFSYRSTPIIKGLNAEILAGRCTVLVGANGAGKSTLISLIAGLDCPSSGSVYLNNFPLRSLSAESLAHHYGYVPQDVFIFGDSLRMNITMGRDIPDSHIHSMLAELGWESFVSEWRFGLDAKIAENGRDLSGGQRQKIAVLRALVNRPSVLILDEPENNLDKHSLEKLVRYLEKLKGYCTVVLVTHGNAFQNVIDATLDVSIPYQHNEPILV